MTQYFLGVDIGGTKSHALIADVFGNALGFGKSGAGNPGFVGYKGLSAVLCTVTDPAMTTAGISKDRISGVGIGIAGYNWLSQREICLHSIQSLELSAPLEIVNDTIIGLLAGATEGWSVALVAGTSCNCRGWDKDRREGRMTGGGFWMGEAAGAIELLVKARQAIAFEWSQRGPSTALTKAFIKLTGAPIAVFNWMRYTICRTHNCAPPTNVLHSNENRYNIENPMEGLTTGYYKLHSEMVSVIFQVAEAGDPVARDIIT
jgi:N-acetylglucosamine kinase-like BadF-type ATPase